MQGIDRSGHSAPIEEGVSQTATNQTMRVWFIPTNAQLSPNFQTSTHSSLMNQALYVNQSSGCRTAVSQSVVGWLYGMQEDRPRADR